MKTRSKSDSVGKGQCSSEHDKTEKCKLSKTEIMRRYRQKLKQNPDKIDKARAKDRERKRMKRLEQRQEIMNGNRELYEHIKSQNKKHMKTYRNNLKSKKANTSKTKITEISGERANLNKEKAVLKTQRWRMRIKLLNETCTETSSRTESTDSATETSESTVTEGPKTDLNNQDCEHEMTQESDSVKSPSRWTLYRVKKKAWKSLPNTPIKKAAIVEKIIESPRTAKILHEKGLCIAGESKKKLDVALDMMEGVKQQIQEMKPSGTQETQKKTAYDTVVNTSIRASKRKTEVLKYLGLSKNKKKKCHDVWWKQNPRKRRKDRISDQIKTRVSEFYLSQEVSREVPNKKDVLCIKEGVSKEYVQKHVMTMTSADAYHTYKKKYPNDKIGFSTFKKLKPKQVRRVSETSRKSCLCQICCNIALKSEALKSFLATDNFKDTEKPPCEKDELIKITLCEKTSVGYYKNSCLRRECSDCGTEKLRPTFETISHKSTQDSLEITWYKWEHIMVDREDNSSKRIISCVPKHTSFDDFMTDLEQGMQEYPGHKFRATWQHEQLLKCLASLTEKELMTIMDFSENYKCSFQNEVQSAYFDQNLVTIHPSMNYYKKKIEDKEILVKHTIVGISNDLKHDSTLVRAFEDKSLNIIKKEVDIETVKQWSDGCAAQYKSKVGFSYLSGRKYNMSRNFFETSHGKNVCDGLGAIVKNSSYRAMLTGKIIGNAVDMFNHCTETLSHGLKVNENDNTGTIREFIFINKDEVDRTNIPDVSTLSGTRKVHCIRNTGTPLTVESRNLSCFCQACLDSGVCENIEYVESWKRSSLKPKPRKSIATEKKPASSACTKPQKAKDQQKTAAALSTACTTVEPTPSATSSESLHAELDSSWSDQYRVDDFVSVQLSGRRSSKCQFVGQITHIDINTGEFKVSFMTKASLSQESLYFWPDEKDESWEALSCITRRLGQPTVSNRSTNRRVLFSFGEDCK